LRVNAQNDKISSNHVLPFKPNFIWQHNRPFLKTALEAFLKPNKIVEKN
jgi:hypothetical protein